MFTETSATARVLVTKNELFRLPGTRLIESFEMTQIFNGIKDSDLLIRNGLLLGALGTHVYLAKKHGRKNLNR